MSEREGFPRSLQLDSVCAAALHCFAANGFHGTSIRQIATQAGLSVPGLYHHYPSKSAVLVRLCDTAMEELLAASRRAAGAAGSVTERFERMVGCLLRFHAEFPEIAFVTFSEIRSLPAEDRRRHIRARRDVQEILTGLVAEGADAGVFATAHPDHSARAIATICVGVSQWYRRDGPMTVDELVSVYTDVCADTVKGRRS